MEIDVKGILERNKKMLADQVEEITKNQLKDALDDQANTAVSEAVEEFLKKEIKPEIKKKLHEFKADILVELTAHLEATVSVIGQKMFEKAKKNLSESWTFSKIVKELFD